MGDREAVLRTGEAVLETLLAAHSDAVVVAMADDGWRVPLPESVPLGSHHALPVPHARTSILDVVVGADRIVVVRAWDQMQRDGIAVASVRALIDPETRLTLTLVDGRDRHGVCLAVLTDDRSKLDKRAEVLAGPLQVPDRPRRATMHKNLMAVITEVNASVTAMLGWAPEQLLGHRASEFVHPEDQERAVTSWMRLASTFTSQRVRLRHRCADGTWLWVEIENIHNGAERSEEVDVIADISDISDEMAAHEAVRRREQLFSRLAESLPTGVLQLRADGSVAYANTRLSALLHTRRPTTLSDLLGTVARGDRAAVKAAVEQALEQQLDCELEVGVLHPRVPKQRRCLLTIAAVPDQDGQPGVLVCVNDVTKSARLREELRLQATHDPLTGCLNRSAVIEALERRLGERNEGVVVIFVDIDGFKPVNDQLGHPAGDQLLIHFARRLQRLSRGHDLVARLGGDEFLLVCHGRELPAAAIAIANRVRRALDQPFILPSGAINLRASLGVAWPASGTTAETLITNADTAMYQSKRSANGEPACFADIADASA